jgi:hypothetical protein
MQSQLSVTIIPDMIDAKGVMTYSKVCVGEKGFHSIEEILNTLPPTQLLFKDIDYVHGCVSVPNFYQVKKK